MDFNLIAFVALTKALHLSSVMFVNGLNASQIAMAAIAGVLLFQEPITLAMGAGVLLTVFGLVLMRKRSGEKPESRNKPTRKETPTSLEAPESVELNVEKQSGSVAQITATIPRADFSKEVGRRLQQARGNLRMKGFRPGKAPMPVVRI